MRRLLHLLRGGRQTADIRLQVVGIYPLLLLPLLLDVQHTQVLSFNSVHAYIHARPLVSSSRNKKKKSTRRRRKRRRRWRSRRKYILTHAQGARLTKSSTGRSRACILHATRGQFHNTNTATTIMQIAIKHSAHTHTHKKIHCCISPLDKMIYL